jgi:hypothetical protein
VRAALAGLLLLGGCSSASTLVGIGAGAIAGGASANPAVGYGVAIGTAAAADYGLKYYGRKRQQGEQDAIAAVVGTLGEGQTGLWKTDHSIPYGNENGEVRVVRIVVSPIAECKQIVFSVIEGSEKDQDLKRAWYTADICRQEKQWKWASAEPAVERWGFLQ